MIIPTAFDLSDGIETGLTDEFPPGLPTVVDTEEDGMDIDYDPAEEAPVDIQLPYEEPAQSLPERSVKAYLVKYTAYRTFVSGS